MSARVRLARLAEQVLASSDAVSATAGNGPRWATADGDHTIEGIVVAETALGELDVELHVVADWPPEPLERLAAHLRGELRRSASNAGLAERLGETHVAIHDIRVPEQDAQAR
ncbi:MAG: hypothetical protein WKF42_09340 [Solirubrobacteraceae bacterium]